MEAKRDNTASITGEVFCKACGWPVVQTCCNDQMGDKHPNSDWWWYCSNQGCRNHKGEDFGMNHSPEWVFYETLPAKVK